LADRIFLIDGGAIIEQGSHWQLIKAGGMYKKIFDVQAKNYTGETGEADIF